MRWIGQVLAGGQRSGPAGLAGRRACPVGRHSGPDQVRLTGWYAEPSAGLVVVQSAVEEVPNLLSARQPANPCLAWAMLR